MSTDQFQTFLNTLISSTSPYLQDPAEWGAAVSRALLAARAREGQFVLMPSSMLEPVRSIPPSVMAMFRSVGLVSPALGLEHAARVHIGEVLTQGFSVVYSPSGLRTAFSSYKKDGQTHEVPFDRAVQGYEYIASRCPHVVAISTEPVGLQVFNRLVEDPYIRRFCVLCLVPLAREENDRYYFMLLPRTRQQADRNRTYEFGLGWMEDGVFEPIAGFTVAWFAARMIALRMQINRGTKAPVDEELVAACLRHAEVLWVRDGVLDIEGLYNPQVVQ